MFQVFNGRLYPNVAPRKLSFKIPDGYWIDTAPEGNSANCITLRTRKQEVTVEVSVGMSGRGKSTEEEVRDVFEGAPLIAISGPNPISVGALKGHSIYCFSSVSQYVILLDVSKCNFRDSFNLNDFFNRMEIVVTASYDSEDESMAMLQDAVHDPGFEELLESIKVE